MEITDSLEVCSKTVDEAIAEALEKLNATKDEVKITVLDAGAKGFLGLGAKPARILAEVVFNPEDKAARFIREIAAAMGVSVETETELRDKNLYINLSGPNMGVFIGKRGQTLDSLQYLVNLAINKGKGNYISVTLDSENYRQRRKETLESLSMGIAKKVKSTQRPVSLEPMSSNERRIIHSALQNDKYVNTHSEGEEPFRNVVVSPKKPAVRKYDTDAKKDARPARPPRRIDILRS